jgi:hypothetical protein
MAQAKRTSGGHSKKSQTGTNGKKNSRRGVKLGSYIPLSEQIQILEAWALGGPGASIQQLSIQFNRDWTAIKRVLEDQKAYELMKGGKLKGMIQANLIGLLDKVVPRLEAELVNPISKHGVELGMDLLERHGLIAPKATRFQTVETEVTEEQRYKSLPQAERIKELTAAYLQLGMESRVAYGEKLPTDQKQLEAEFKRRRAIDIPLVEVHEEENE